MSKAEPGIHVVSEPDRKRPGRDVTVIIQRHELRPHAVTGRIQVDTVSQLMQLRRKLKAQEDLLLEETRARAQRPEACGSGHQVPRRPTLDEIDGDD